MPSRFWKAAAAGAGLTAIAAAATTLALGQGAPTSPAAIAPKSAPTTIAGVAWETSFGSAAARARRENKPVLLLQLFGRLDQELC